MIMRKVKKLAFAGLALCCQFVHAANVFNKDMLIGCGTIVSVRNVNQPPLMEYEYAVQNGLSISGTDIATAMSIYGVTGIIKGAIISTVAETLLHKDAVKVKEQESWKNVQAVRIKMDSGEEINIPLYKPRTDNERRQYADGKRVVVYHLPEYNSIQLQAMIRVPMPPDGLDKENNTHNKTPTIYEFHCKRRLDDSIANGVLKQAANLVQEDKIIP